MTSGARGAARRQRLLADNRCINCADKLAFADIGERQECARCRAVRAERDEVRITERKEADLCPACGDEAEDGYAWCAKCRKGQRERWNLRPYDYKRHPNGPQPMTRWKDVEADPNACPRCSLRGEHVCISRGAFATARGDR